MKTKFNFFLGLATALFLVAGITEANAFSMDTYPIVHTIDGNPIGVWKFTVTGVPEGNVKGTMTVRKKGDSYEVQFSSSAGVTNLADVVYKDNKLSGKLTVEEYITLDFSGTFDGAKFTGKFGSDYGDFPITASRAEK